MTTSKKPSYSSCRPKDLRRAAEALLRRDETLSAFIEESVQRNVDFRQAQQAFLERGLASGASAKASGEYVSSSAVLHKLSRRIAKARRGRAA